MGAIVGGGIFVLAGVAFAATGPGAMLAFALNGAIAAITALSFAEMSSAYPESGGAYAFAKRVLSVRSAFAMGWILWFAYIIAAVLYALGFASYGAVMLHQIGERWLGVDWPFFESRGGALILALGATGLYTWVLARKSHGGGQMATVGKLVVFCVHRCGGGVGPAAYSGRAQPAEALAHVSPRHVGSFWGYGLHLYRGTGF